MSCKVVRVISENGKPSKLYSDIFDAVGNQNESLKLYLDALIKQEDNLEEFPVKARTFNVRNKTDFSHIASVGSFAKNNKLDIIPSEFARRNPDTYDFLFKTADLFGVSISSQLVPIKSTIGKANAVKNVAYYSTLNNKINFSSFFDYLSDEDKSRVLAHEVIHSIIYNKMLSFSDQKKASFEKDIQELINSIKTNKNLMKQSSVKKVMDIVSKNGYQELITYAFTDRSFAAALNGEVIEGEQTEKKTFWKRLKEIILSVISDDRTMFDNLSDIMDTYFNLDEGNFDNTESSVDENGEPNIKSIYPELYNQAKEIKESKKGFKRNKYREFDDEEQQFFETFVKNAHPSVRDTYYSIIDFQKNIKLNTEGTHYIYTDPETGEEVLFERVSNRLDQMFPNDAFTGDSSLYADNAEYGNQMDSLLTYVIENDRISYEGAKSFIQSEINKRNKKNNTNNPLFYSEEAIKKAMSIFYNFVSEQRSLGYVVLSQKLVYSEAEKTAGTTDILILKPGGIIDIVDLKTSLDPFVGTYIKNGKEASYTRPIYIKNDDGSITIKAPKKVKHTRQQSAYKGSLVGLGFNPNIGISIFPIHLLMEKGTITGIENTGPQQYNLIPLSAIEEVEKKFAGKNASKISSYQKFIFEMKAVLAEEIEKLKKGIKIGTKGEVDVALQTIKEMERNISIANEAEAISKFVNSLYNDVVLKFAAFKSFKTQLAQEDNLSESELHKMIKDANNYVAIAERYLPYLGRLTNIAKDIYGNTYGDADVDVLANIERDSPLYKAYEITKNLNEIKNSYIDLIIPLLAKRFYLTSTNKTSKKVDKEKQIRIDRLTKEKKDLIERRLEAIKKSPDNLSKANRIQKKINKKTAEINRLKRIGEISEKKFIEAFKGIGATDVRVVERMLFSAVSSKDIGISTLANIFKNKFGEIERESLSFEFDLMREYDKLKKKISRNSNNPAEFNKDIYEFTLHYNNETGKLEERVSFVTEIDISRFNKDYNKVLQEAKTLRLNRENVKSIEVIQKFLKKNLTVTTDYLDTLKSWEDDYKKLGFAKEDFYETIMDVAFEYESYKQVLTEEITTEEYALGLLNKLKTNPSKVLRYKLDNPLLEIDKDKYRNSNWDKLYHFNGKPRGPIGELHKLLTDKYREIQEELPEYMKLGNLLPSISKNDNDRLREQGVLKTAKYKKKEAFNYTESDLSEYGSSDNAVPLEYSWNMPAKDVSLDLIQSVIRFKHSIDRYKYSLEAAEDAEALIRIYKQRKVETLSPLNKSKIKSISKKIGRKISQAEENKEALLQLQRFVDREIYLKRKNRLGKGTVRWEKILGTISSALSLSQIAIKPFLGLSNLGSAEMQLMIEAAAGEHFNPKTHLKANRLFLKLIPDYIRDFGRSHRTSLLGQLLQQYDAIQGSFKDEFGRKLTHSALKKAYSTDTLFSNMHHGELKAQSTLMLNILLNTKVKLNGKEIPLFDAYELDEETKKIKLKKGVEGDFNGLVVESARDLISSLNKKLNGVYNDFDAMEVESNAIGALLTVYRKFIPEGFKRRYGKFNIDPETGLSSEGYYRTFFNVFIKDLRKNLKFLFSEGGKLSEKYSPQEIANLRRSAMEISIQSLLTLATIILAMGYYDDDDDKRKYYRHSYFLTLRLQSELSFFINPADAGRLIATPAASYSLLQKSFNLLAQMLAPTEVYKKDPGGIWEKGDNKLLAKLVKLIGISGQTYNPDNIIRFYDAGKLSVKAYKNNKD